MLKIESDADFRFDQAMSTFNDELRSLRQNMGSKKMGDGVERTWNYREWIYEAKEQQIDVRTTKMPIDELWKLVDFQEKGDHENYYKFARPKQWKFVQEQKELLRREMTADHEKRKQRQRRYCVQREDEGEYVLHRNHWEI